MNRFLVILLLPLAALGQIPPMPPAQPSVTLAQSPRGAANSATFVPMFVVPPTSQGIVLSAPVTNGMMQLSTVLPFVKRWQTNFTASLVLSNSFLNTFTNPITYSQRLGWNASTDATVIGYCLYYGPASGDYTNFVKVQAGDATSGIIQSLPPTKQFYAATSYNAAGVQSPFSNEVSGTPDAFVPPGTWYFRTKQTNGPAPVLTVRRL